MLVFIIFLASSYIVSVAFLLVGIWKASYGFEDERGFHSVGAPPSPRCEIGDENPANDRESEGGASEAAPRAPSRSWRRTSRIRRRNSGSSSRKKTQLWTA